MLLQQADFLTPPDWRAKENNEFEASVSSSLGRSEASRRLRRVAHMPRVRALGDGAVMPRRNRAFGTSGRPVRRFGARPPTTWAGELERNRGVLPW